MSVINSIGDLRALARRRVPRAIFEYADRGSYDELTLARNRSDLQQREFALETAGYRAAKHQAFVGTGYFDAVQTAITGGQFSTGAMSGSTEHEQFTPSSTAAKSRVVA